MVEKDIVVWYQCKKMYLELENYLSLKGLASESKNTFFSTQNDHKKILSKISPARKKSIDYIALLALVK